MKLLADTSALLALFFRDDGNHRAAAEFLGKNGQTRFILTELILAEVVTRLRARADAKAAVAVARELLRSRRYEVVFIEPQLLENALHLMERFADKRLSLADCASFETIRRLGLAGAFTFDRDFRDCGFGMFP